MVHSGTRAFLKTAFVGLAVTVVGIADTDKNPNPEFKKSGEACFNLFFLFYLSFNKF